MPHFAGDGWGGGDFGGDFGEPEEEDLTTEDTEITEGIWCFEYDAVDFDFRNYVRIRRFKSFSRTSHSL